MLKKIWVWIKRLIFFAWCFALLGFGMWVWWENQIPVTVNYIGLGQSMQTLGTVIFAMLLLGFFLGFATNWLSAKTRVYWQKRKYNKANRELELMKKTQALE